MHASESPVSPAETLQAQMRKLDRMEIAASKETVTESV